RLAGAQLRAGRKAVMHEGRAAASQRLAQHPDLVEASLAGSARDRVGTRGDRAVGQRHLDIDMRARGEAGKIAATGAPTGETSDPPREIAGRRDNELEHAHSGVPARRNPSITRAKSWGRKRGKRSCAVDKRNVGSATRICCTTAWPSSHRPSRPSAAALYR